jgi:hypothetical protein
LIRVSRSDESPTSSGVVVATRSPADGRADSAKRSRNAAAAVVEKRSFLSM